MNRTLVDRITNAVLYEGYILYPYRPSVKNRQRWTFGGLYPRSYSQAQQGSDAWSMQTECLMAGSPSATLQVTIRFLHLLLRQVGELVDPRQDWPVDREPEFRAVASLQVDGKEWYTWQEAVERTVDAGAATLGELALGPRQHRFHFPSTRALELLHTASGHIAGVLVRRQEALEGLIEVSASAMGNGLFKVRVRIENHTEMDDAGRQSRDDALLHALVSTHTILGVREGDFVSLLDPPKAWREQATGCRNEGTWPVLVGEEGEKDTMLSSPIILYDYPQIAPESPADLFDGSEIDEILTLRILTLTDEEKQAMAAVDERARALLHRAESLTREEMLGLHGTISDLRPVTEEARHE
jgi:hydrogenase maturation protease